MINGSQLSYRGGPFEPIVPTKRLWGFINWWSSLPSVAKLVVVPLQVWKLAKPLVGAMSRLSPFSMLLNNQLPISKPEAKELAFYKFLFGSHFQSAKEPKPNEYQLVVEPHVDMRRHNFLGLMIWLDVDPTISNHMGCMQSFFPIYGPNFMCLLTAILVNKAKIYCSPFGLCLVTKIFWLCH